MEFIPGENGLTVLKNHVVLRFREIRQATTYHINKAPLSPLPLYFHPATSPGLSIAIAYYTVVFIAGAMAAWTTANPPAAATAAIAACTPAPAPGAAAAAA